MELTRGLVGETGIAYCSEGPADAPAIVFINSLGTDHRLWDAQRDALVHDHRVIRFDFCGHGASEVPREAVSIATFGDDVIALLDHLGIERAHVCGCSLGGMISLWLAAERPARVVSAVLANTGARVGTLEGWNTRIDTVRREGMDGIVESVLSRFLSPAFHARDPVTTETIRSMLRATDPRGYIAACEALRAADLHGSLAKVRVPTLVVVSTLDVSTPPSLGEALHAGIAGSQLAVIHDAAHLSNVEQADAFNGLLLSWSS
jgi:3-oxoadipate enol-lactonase